MFEVKPSYFYFYLALLKATLLMLKDLFQIEDNVLFFSVFWKSEQDFAIFVGKKAWLHTCFQRFLCPAVPMDWEPMGAPVG